MDLLEDREGLKVAQIAAQFIGRAVRKQDHNNVEAALVETRLEQEGQRLLTSSAHSINDQRTAWRWRCRRSGTDVVDALRDAAGRRRLRPRTATTKMTTISTTSQRDDCDRACRDEGRSSRADREDLDAHSRASCTRPEDGRKVLRRWRRRRLRVAAADVRVCTGADDALARTTEKQLAVLKDETTLYDTRPLKDGVSHDTPVDRRTDGQDHRRRPRSSVAPVGVDGAA